MRPGRIGTAIDHALGIEVEAHVKTSQRAAEGVADLKAARRDHSPLDR